MFRHFKSSPANILNFLDSVFLLPQSGKVPVWINHSICFFFLYPSNLLEKYKMRQIGTFKNSPSPAQFILQRCWLSLVISRLTLNGHFTTSSPNHHLHPHSQLMTLLVAIRHTTCSIFLMLCLPVLPSPLECNFCEGRDCGLICSLHYSYHLLKQCPAPVGDNMWNE